MPIAIGDPGVFVCGPGDIAPWEDSHARMPVRERAHAGAGPAHEHAPVHGVWLVLRGCCGRVYCHRHDSANWWLTNYHGPPFNRRRDESAGDDP